MTMGVKFPKCGFCFFLFVMTLISGLASQCQAAVYTPADIAELRRDIDLANSNPGTDTIVLAAGTTYVFEGVSTDSARLDVDTSGGDLDVVDDLIIEGNGAVIDTNGNDRALYIAGYQLRPEPTDVTIRELTIVNGKTDSLLNTPGGGILVDYGSLMLVRCTIRGCETVENGGAVAAFGSDALSRSSLTVISSTISGNRAANGGGIFTCLADLTVRDSEISGNEATAEVFGSPSSPGPRATQGGGGILATGADCAVEIDGLSLIAGNVSKGYAGGAGFFATAQTSVTDTIISGNAADPSPYLTDAAGGGVNCFEASPVLTQCLITSNTARLTGGGVNCQTGAAPLLVNSTLSGNRLNGPAPMGGAMYLAEASHPSIVNTIFEGSNGSAIHAEAGSEPNMLVACLFDNNDAALTDEGDPTSGTYGNGDVGLLNANLAYAWDNVSGSAGFVDKAAGDYHVLLGAAIDNATSAAARNAVAVTAPAADLDGRPRPVDVPGWGSDGPGEGYDIGAYEAALPPEIGVDPTSFLLALPEGGAPADVLLRVANLTPGTTLEYNVLTPPTWLSAAPGGGTVAGDSYITETLTATPAGLNAGDYPGVTVIDAVQASNDPLDVPFLLRVTDNPPTVTIDGIDPNPARPPVDMIVFEGSAADAAGAITAYEWRSSLDGLLETTEDFILPSLDLTVGDHTIMFTAWDDEGTSRSDSAPLTVVNALPTASIVSFVPNVVPVGAPVMVTLDAHDNDEQGQSLTWSQLDWPDNFISNIAPGVHVIDAPPFGGTFNIRYRVRDDENTWSAWATMPLTVLPPVIAANPTSLSLTVVEGRITTAPLGVFNAGAGTLWYTADTTPSVLTIDPPASSSTGVLDVTTHTVTWDASWLPPGDYGGTITLTDPVAANSPLYVPVSTRVTTGPIFGYDPAAFVSQAYMGENAATQTLKIWNAGMETLAYIVETTPSWLAVLPPVGVSDGPASRTLHDVIFQTSALAQGDYAGTITLVDPAARNNPVAIPVRLTIGPPKPALLITNPAGGETWVAGEQVTVEWTCANAGPGEQLILSLRGPDWVGWATVPAVNGPNSVNLYVPPNLTAGTYRVRLSWRRDVSVFTESQPIQIVSHPTIAVDIPTGGETYVAGTQVGVQWTCSNNTNNDDMYLSLRGPEWRAIGPVASTDGPNTANIWIPSDLTPGTYQLRVSWSQNFSVWSESLPFEVVAAPQCTITVPAGGETWMAGEQATIEWTCSNNPGSDPMYVSIRGPDWRGLGTVASPNGPNSASVWLPPDLTPGTYQIRLSWTENFSVWFESAPVTVAVHPTCTITVPAGGETWTIGTQVTVEWNCANNPGGDPMYLSLRGTEWRGWGTVPSPNGSNSATKLIPVNLAPGTYRVRISWTENYSVWFESAPITIIAPP